MITRNHVVWLRIRRLFVRQTTTTGLAARLTRAGF